MLFERLGSGVNYCASEAWDHTTKQLGMPLGDYYLNLWCSKRMDLCKLCSIKLAELIMLSIIASEIQLRRHITALLCEMKHLNLQMSKENEREMQHDTPFCWKISRIINQNTSKIPSKCENITGKCKGNSSKITTNFNQNVNNEHQNVKN